MVEHLAKLTAREAECVACSYLSAFYSRTDQKIRPLCYNNPMITYKQITEFGLDEKEARVFLASLELGGENVLTIAKKAGINRVATYEALESLIKKGLVSTFHKGKRVNYTATDPERLLHLLEQEKNRLAQKETIFQGQEEA